MDKQAFVRWLDEFSRVWETRTADRGEIEALFANPTRWGSSTSPAVIADTWMSEVGSETGIRLQWEVLCVTDTVGVAVLTGSWIEKRTALVEGEGVFIAKLSEQGKAVELDEYWQSRSTPLPAYR